MDHPKSDHKPSINPKARASVVSESDKLIAHYGLNYQEAINLKKIFDQNQTDTRINTHRLYEIFL